MMDKIKKGIIEESMDLTKQLKSLSTRALGKLVKLEARLSLFIDEDTKLKVIKFDGKLELTKFAMKLIGILIPTVTGLISGLRLLFSIFT